MDIKTVAATTLRAGCACVISYAVTGGDPWWLAIITAVSIFWIVEELLVVVYRD